eukprot:TRINITY_DN17059_c0_g1_i2.p1 TRINITY_DN17059_c0_g1~~TRINITY_DN17059_c0_g1_i2.p1  ORF type:complete len:440 (+),score=113.16 TRINITY_DN17059_c0_g1_i2:57-1322(+)
MRCGAVAAAAAAVPICAALLLGVRVGSREPPGQAVAWHGEVVDAAEARHRIDTARRLIDSVLRWHAVKAARPGPSDVPAPAKVGTVGSERAADLPELPTGGRSNPCVDEYPRNWVGFPVCRKCGYKCKRCVSVWKPEFQRQCNYTTWYPEQLSLAVAPLLRGGSAFMLGDSELRELAGAFLKLTDSPVTLSKAKANMWNNAQVDATVPGLEAQLRFKFASRLPQLREAINGYAGPPVDLLVVSSGLHDATWTQEEGVAAAEFQATAERELRELGAVMREAMAASRPPWSSRTLSAWVDPVLECSSPTIYRSANTGAARERCGAVRQRLESVRALARVHLPVDVFLPEHPCDGTCTIDGMHDKPCSRSSQTTDDCFKRLAWSKLLALFNGVATVSKRQVIETDLPDLYTTGRKAWQLFRKQG